MKKILLLFLLTKFLFASNLLTYTVYDRKNRVDLMLTFDEPYNGKIKKRKIDNYMIVKLYDLFYKREVKEKVDSTIVDEVDIVPKKNSTYVIFKIKKDIKLKIDKTIDNFGLRIRALPKIVEDLTPKPVVAPIKEKPQAKEEILKKEDEDKDFKIGKSSSVSIGYAYYIALFILLAIALSLYFLRNSLKDKKNIGGWLFKKAKDKEICIKFQRAIDARNRVVLIEYQNSSYLVLIGNTNILLDKFGSKNIKKEEEFEDIFEKNRQRLDEYLKLNEEKLQNYKDKVSKDIENLLK